MELKKSELFSGLSRIEQARLIGSLEKLVLKKGETVFRAGDAGDSLFIIQEGEVNIYNNLEDGSRHSLAYFKAGDIFGEMALLTGKSRSASAEAKTDAVIYKLVREKFNQILDENSFFSSYLLKLLCERLGEANITVQQSLDQNISGAKEVLSYLDSKERIAVLFLTRLPHHIKYLSFVSSYFDLPALQNRILNSTDLYSLLEEAKDQISFRAKLEDTFFSGQERDDFLIFLRAVSGWHISQKELQPALRLYIYNQLWEEAVELFQALPEISEGRGSIPGSISGEEMLYRKREHGQPETATGNGEQVWQEQAGRKEVLYQEFRDCPLDVFQKHFTFFLDFLRYYARKEPEAGFRLIEEMLNNATDLTGEQMLDLYKTGADYCEIMGLKQKALEYLNMAKHISDNLSSAGAGEENYFMERRYLESVKSRDRAKTEGKIIPKNAITGIITITGALASLLWFGVISEPLAGLSPEAMWFIGIALATVIFWISEWIPDYVVALLMGFGWVLTGVATTGEALVGYASPSWFFMIFVFGISVALTKTGLLYRLSLWTLKIFPKTYAGQIMGIAVSGVLINPFLPSATVKAAMSAPIARSIAEAMGFGENSSGSAGLGSAAMIFHGFLSPFFLTASFANLLALGIAGIEVGWMQWFIYSLPSLVFFCIGMYAAILFLYKPEKESKKLSVEVIDSQLAILGKLTIKEKITIFLTLTSVLLLITQTMHGLETVWIMFIPFALLILTGVLTTKNLKSDIEWGFLIFIGMTFSFGEIVADVGVIDVIGKQVSVFMEPFMHSAFLFVLAVSLISIAISFFIKDDTVVILLVVALAPVAAIANADPWIVVFVIILTSGPFFFPYQSAIYLAAYYSSEGKCFTHKQAKKLSVAFAIVMVLAALISAPFWVWQGLL